MAVTASHNPAIYNGIKVFTKGGRDADELVTRDIEKYIAKMKDREIPVVPYEEGVRTGWILPIDPMNPYVDSIIRAVNMDAIRSCNLKVVLDPDVWRIQNGASDNIDYCPVRCGCDP